MQQVTGKVLNGQQRFCKYLWPWKAKWTLTVICSKKISIRYPFELFEKAVQSNRSTVQTVCISITVFVFIPKLKTSLQWIATSVFERLLWILDAIAWHFPNHSTSVWKQKITINFSWQIFNTFNLDKYPNNKRQNRDKRMFVYVSLCNSQMRKGHAIGHWTRVEFACKLAFFQCGVQDTYF